MHIALDGRDDDFAGFAAFAALLERFDRGHEFGDGAFHHASALHHLREEHAAGGEELSDASHAVHEGPFDDFHRRRIGLERLRHVFGDIGVVTLDQRARDAFRERFGTPLIGRRGFFCFGFEPGCDFDHLFRRAGIGVEHDGLRRFAQFRIKVFVDSKLGGVDDAHGHSGVDRVLEEHRVDGAADRVVAAEGERDIADSAADSAERHVRVNVAYRLNEVDCVVVVLLHAGCDGENIRIEYDVFGRDARLFGQKSVGAFADFDSSFQRVRLSFFIERHDENRRAETPDFPRFFEKLLFTFLEADGIDDAFALNAAERGFDDFPVGGVDHDRHAGNFRFGGEVEQKTLHRGGGIEHGVVHVDVDD